VKKGRRRRKETKKDGEEINIELVLGGYHSTTFGD
jgi:hypothetical protein